MAANKVYVGNLDFKVSDEELETFMGQAGHVTNLDLARSANGNSKGFALVEYETAEEADRAVKQLNDKELGSRSVFVREDRGPGNPAKKERRPRQEGRPNRYDRRENKIAPLRVRAADKGRLLYVGNIPWRTSWQDLKDLFREAGEVIRVDIPTASDGRSRGFATVLFETPEAAADAIRKFHDMELEGRKLIVREDQYA
jgi:RNA recognition motif-containing protein